MSENIFAALQRLLLRKSLHSYHLHHYHHICMKNMKGVVQFFARFYIARDSIAQYYVWCKKCKTAYAMIIKLKLNRRCVVIVLTYMNGLLRLVSSVINEECTRHTPNEVIMPYLIHHYFTLHYSCASNRDMAMKMTARYRSGALI